MSSAAEVRTDDILKESHEYTDDLRRLYGSLVVSLRDLAKGCGYVVGVEGEPWMIISLLVCPFAKFPADAKSLVHAMRHVAEEMTGKGHISWREGRKEWWEEGRPGGFPQGVLGWSIHVGGGGVVHLHVWPRATAPEGGA